LGIVGDRPFDPGGIATNVHDGEQFKPVVANEVHRLVRNRLSGARR